jgi:hypothetical protein
LPIAASACATSTCCAIWNASSTSAGKSASGVDEAWPSSASSSVGVGTREPVGVGVREATSGPSSSMKGLAAAY